MTTDLKALAQAIARELALRDRPPAGPPPRLQNGAQLAKGAYQNPATPGTALLTSQPGPPPGVRWVKANARIADFIDHTLLKAEATQSDVERLCDEAREHKFAAVCVNPSWVALCATRLAGSSVDVATVVGFPLGATTHAAKRAESAEAVAAGAHEVDMVIPLGHAKSGDWHYVADDIAAVVAGAQGRLVKVILESSALTPVEVIKACAIAKEMGAQYVKTSTGFHASGGATPEAVALMRLVVGDALGVKASGGVRDCDAALRMIASGATRIGTSSGVSMAMCLGQGPLPLADLVSLAGRHHQSCQTCQPGGAPGSY